jgi:hypothetical protein
MTLDTSKGRGHSRAVSVDPHRPAGATLGGGLELDEDPAVANGVYEIEIVIDAPVAHVWEQFLDVGSWVTSHRIEEVGDLRRTLGAITRVSPREDVVKNVEAQGPAIPLPHHHYCKIIKFVPEEQYSLKTYAEKGGSYGLEEFLAFDDSRFVAIDGKTKLTFTLFSHVKGDLVAHDSETMTRSMDGSRAGMVANLENLQRIVQSKTT